MTGAAVDEVVELLKTLRLPHMRRHAPDVLATAKAQRWDPAEAMRALLVEELAGRTASSITTRRTAAGFPTGKTFATWDETISSIPAPTQRSLATLEWIDGHENLVVCGPSGTGKSHLLEALGHAAIEHGAHVYWFSLEALGSLVHRHRVDDTMTRAHQTIGAVHSGLMRPAREIHGVAAGIRAALAHLVSGGRPSVAQATQDEEMFI